MALTSRGLRENDDGTRTPIGDATLAGRLRLRGRRVWVMTVAATVAAAGVLLSAPHPL